MINRSRVWGAAVVLLLLSVLVSACGSAVPASNWPGLTVAGGTVYAITGLPQKVYMVDAETGVQKGMFMPAASAAFKGQTFWWSPVTVGEVTVGEETAFVGFASPTDKVAGLFAFNPATGQELWSVAADDLILAAPTYADGTVYFGTSSGRVYAVDTKVHTVKNGWPFQAKEAIWGSPLVIGERVYVPAMDHRLYCLNAKTAEVVWEFQAGGALAAQPSPNDGTLYQGAFDGRVYAVEAASGQQVSGFDFQAGNWIWSEVLVADGRLYVTSLDGKLYALDAATGQVQAGYPYSAGAADYIRAAPAQVDGLVVIATGSGQVVALNAQTGAKVGATWTGAQGLSILTAPVVSGERVYVLLSSGLVQTFTVVEGQLATGWNFAPPATP